MKKVQDFQDATEFIVDLYLQDIGDVTSPAYQEFIEALQDRGFKTWRKFKVMFKDKYDNLFEIHFVGERGGRRGFDFKYPGGR